LGNRLKCRQVVQKRKNSSGQKIPTPKSAHETGGDVGVTELEVAKNALLQAGVVEKVKRENRDNVRNRRWGGNENQQKKPTTLQTITLGRSRWQLKKGGGVITVDHKTGGGKRKKCEREQKKMVHLGTGETGGKMLDWKKKK